MIFIQQCPADHNQMECKKGNAGIVYFIVLSIKQQTGIKVVGAYFQNSAH